MTEPEIRDPVYISDSPKVYSYLLLKKYVTALLVYFNGIGMLYRVVSFVRFSLVPNTDRNKYDDWYDVSKWPFHFGLEVPD